MPLQGIGQGFESPHLHKNGKGIMGAASRSELKKFETERFDHEVERRTLTTEYSNCRPNRKSILMILIQICKKKNDESQGKNRVIKEQKKNLFLASREKLLRAYGGCLGAECRRRTWDTAISPEEL